MNQRILEQMSNEELITFAQRSDDVVNAYADIMYAKDSLIDMLFRVSGHLKEMEHMSILLREHRKAFFEFDEKMFEKYSPPIRYDERPVCESEKCHCPKFEELDNAVSEFVMNEMKGSDDEID